MALEALADVLANLGQRYQNKVEDENKRQEHLSDLADERAWIEGRTSQQQQFESGRDKQHVADEKDLRKFSSDLDIENLPKKLEAETQAMIEQTRKLAPVQRGKRLFDTGIADSVEQGMTMSAAAEEAATRAKVARDTASALDNQINNLPKAELLEDAQKKPVFDYFNQQIDLTRQQMENIKQQLAQAQVGSDENSIANAQAKAIVDKVQLDKKSLKLLATGANPMTAAQFASASPIEQLSALASSGIAGISYDRVTKIWSAAKDTAKQNQQDSMVLSRSLSEMQTSIRDFTGKAGAYAPRTPAKQGNNITPPAASAAMPAPDTSDSALTTSSYFGPSDTRTQGGVFPWAKPLTPPSSSFVTPPPSGLAPVPSFFAPPAAAAPAVAPMSAPVTNNVVPPPATAPTPVTAAPAAATSFFAPQPPPASTPVPTATTPNNITPPVVIYPEFTGDGNDQARSQLASAKAQLQALSNRQPGYDLNAAKAQLQNRIDALQRIITPPPSFFQMKSIDSETDARPSYDAPNNIIPQGFS